MNSLGKPHLNRQDYDRPPHRDPHPNQPRHILLRARLLHTQRGSRSRARDHDAATRQERRVSPWARGGVEAKGEEGADFGMSERMSHTEFQRRHGNCASVNMPELPTQRPHIRMPKPVKKSKPEAEYERLLEREFKGCRVRYEAYRLKLPSGTAYTADFSVTMADNRLLFVEVKGSFRLGSAARSALAFKEAAAAFPEHIFRHVTAEKVGWSCVQVNDEPNNKTR